ncbi:MAG: phosphodiester glycosidase family protein [Sphaerochaetaceae bacterium]
MKSQILSLKHSDGKLQRYEIVSEFSFNQLNFGESKFIKKSVWGIKRLYEANIMVKDPSLFKRIIFYHFPEKGELVLPKETEEGIFFDKQLLLTQWMEQEFKKGNLNFDGNNISCKNKSLESIIKGMKNSQLLEISIGKGKDTYFIPVSSSLGYASQSGEKNFCNSNFFLMDPTDKDSPYDSFGTGYGLLVKDGEIILPPALHRKAFFLDDNNNISIVTPEVSKLKIYLDGKTYTSQNSRIFERPSSLFSKAGDVTDIVISGRKVVAIHKGGNSRLPMAGFVLQIKGEVNLKDLNVSYSGFENIKFAIQIGPILINKKDCMKSLETPFFDPDKDTIAFPPTSYPLSFEKGRAARIALGVKDGLPLLIWAEGPSKIDNSSGMESAGVSLKEFTDFGCSLDLDYLVNLDGGGSSQLVVDGTKKLRICDRDADNNLEIERPVPNFLIIEE